MARKLLVSLLVSEVSCLQSGQRDVRDAQVYFRFLDDTDLAQLPTLLDTPLLVLSLQDTLNQQDLHTIKLYAFFESLMKGDAHLCETEVRAVGAKSIVRDETPRLSCMRGPSHHPHAMPATESV
jgi:hypothetical protein